LQKLRKLRSFFFVAKVAKVAKVALRFRPRTCYYIYIYYIFYYPFNIKNIIILYFLYSSPSFLIEPFCLSVLPPLSLQPSSKTHAQHSQQSQHFLHAQLSQLSQPFSNTTAPNQCTGLTMHPSNLGYCPWGSQNATPLNLKMLRMLQGFYFPLKFEGKENNSYLCRGLFYFRLWHIIAKTVSLGLITIRSPIHC